MCLRGHDGWREGEKDLLVWKVVRRSFDGTFWSPYPTMSRLTQKITGQEVVKGFPTGKSMMYPSRGPVEDLEGEGMYVFLNADRAIEEALLLEHVHCSCKHSRILVCLVPKGTMVRTGLGRAATVRKMVVLCERTFKCASR